MDFKKILLAMLLTASSMVAMGQGKIDTLYYDKNWKAVPHSLFAEYVVYTYETGDASYENRYKSFYNTGQVQSEGAYLYFDRQDANKSVYSNERIVYAKNGDIIESSNYKNGYLDGLCVFRNNDNTIDYADFREGSLAKTYIVRQYPNGILLKCDPETGKIIKDIPIEEDREDITIDGDLWEYYNLNGITVAANANIVKEYGKYIQLSLLVANNTPNSIEFGVNNINAVKAHFYNADWELKQTEYGEVLDHNDYARVIKNRQTWREIGLGVLTGLSTATTNYNNTINTNVYTPYYNARITTTYFDNAAYQQQLNRDAALLMSQSVLHAQDLQRLSVGYLKENTIVPNQELSGFVMIPYDFFYSGKYTVIEVTIEVDGIQYLFGFKWTK